MDTIKLDSNVLINYFVAKGVDASNKDLAMALYDAAHKYENAIDRIAEFSERLQKSIQEVAQGRTPMWGLSETAMLVEKYVVEKKEAEHLFNTVAKIADFIVEKDA